MPSRRVPNSWVSRSGAPPTRAPAPHTQRQSHENPTQTGSAATTSSRSTSWPACREEARHLERDEPAVAETARPVGAGRAVAHDVRDVPGRHGLVGRRGRRPVGPARRAALRTAGPGRAGARGSGSRSHRSGSRRAGRTAGPGARPAGWARWAREKTCRPAELVGEPPDRRALERHRGKGDRPSRVSARWSISTHKSESPPRSKKLSWTRPVARGGARPTGRRVAPPSSDRGAITGTSSAGRSASGAEAHADRAFRFR